MDIKDLKPKVAVVLIGTNNMKNTPEEIASGVKAVLAKTQATFPGVKIILVSIMPNKRQAEKMMAANAIIKGYANNTSIYWLDLVPVMPPVATTSAGWQDGHQLEGLGQGPSPPRRERLPNLGRCDGTVADEVARGKISLVSNLRHPEPVEGSLTIRLGGRPRKW